MKRAKLGRSQAFYSTKFNRGEAKKVEFQGGFLTQLRTVKSGPSLRAARGGPGGKPWTPFVKAALGLAGRGTRSVPWRGCWRGPRVAGLDDLPVPMENPYKEPLKKCILCGKRVDYKNIQVFVGRNRKKSQKQLKELK
ncbi:28S ribosomal protein S18c, mitochondrial-like [Mustela putorius furo]|uniref:28S ribosomal protein S18c, mitochondrial-like n=1 Tax=Mustela putorius furo TaxID=9669 RepID=A0A8U0URC6_MUSPF|nr:28S ribosomal protein S18c, mitochondrial-like [Mustela putorius furo]